MLRAGPFSDERVIGLANRRFVAFYFDLDSAGAAGDADARAFVVAKEPALGARSVPTPPVLFMSPGGEVLGKVSNYASAQQVLDAMLSVLAEHPEYAKPSAEEARTVDRVARARILVELQDLKGAKAILAGLNRTDASLLRAKIARREHDWDAMEESLTEVEDEGQALMERAHRLWYEGKYAELGKHLGGFPRGHVRYTEARYHEGLAYYHLGDEEKALAIWKETITSCAQDPWVYRADWAYCGVKDGSQTGFSTLGDRTSCLNRIGYMGRRNPDLERQ